MPKAAAAEALTRLGQRLRARRLFLQLPLVWTAQQMKLSRSQLQAYEAGQGNPPAFTLLQMAKVLGTTCSHLLAEKEKPNVEIDRAVALMADPAINEVANAMWRMDQPNRHAVLLGIREMGV